MTISISESAHDELFDEMSAVEATRHPDPLDEQDFLGSFPPELGKGIWRTITLRDGLEVNLGNLQLHDRYLSTQREFEEDRLELHLHLSGVHECGGDLIAAGQYGLYGTGLSPWMKQDFSDQQDFWEVLVYVPAKVFRSFIGNSNGELPAALQPWIRPVEQPAYRRFGTVTPAMQLAARQMLRCGFRGVAKRMFLEGKALELLALVAEVEIERHGSDRPWVQTDLVDRIHDARGILRQRIDNPPNLGELSRLVGLNECTLKQGFRQVFGTTVFGYLHDYRLEQAQELLMGGEMKISEVAEAIGFGDRSYFAAAFRKKFGYNPSALKRKRR